MDPSTFSRSIVRGSADDPASTPGETPPEPVRIPKARLQAPHSRALPKRSGISCGYKGLAGGLRPREIPRWRA